MKRLRLYAVAYVAPLIAISLGLSDSKAEEKFTLDYPCSTVYLPMSRILRSDSLYKVIHVQGCRCSYFFTIRYLNKSPEHGVFDVEGKAVEPQVSLVGANINKKSTKAFAKPVTIARGDAGRFSVTFWDSGKFTFEASVGKYWSKRVTVNAEMLPFQSDIRTSEFLKQFGFPSEEHEFKGGGRYWAYERWPGLVLLAGETSILHVLTLPDSQVRKDGLPEWNAPELPKMAGQSVYDNVTVKVTRPTRRK